MKYATAAAFRQALDDRLTTEAMKTGLGIARLRKRVAFELFLRRLVAVAPNRWVLKGALALDFRFHATNRPTRDMDLGRADDEDAAIEDLAAAQALALDDFFTFAARRTDALDDADDFRQFASTSRPSLPAASSINSSSTSASSTRSPRTRTRSRPPTYSPSQASNASACPLCHSLSTSRRRFMPTPASTVRPDAKAHDRRTSSTSCSSVKRDRATGSCRATPGFDTRLDARGGKPHEVRLDEAHT